MDLRKPSLIEMILKGWGDGMSYVNKKYFGESFKRIYITNDNDNLLEFFVFTQSLTNPTLLLWGEKTLNLRKIQTVFYLKQV